MNCRILKRHNLLRIAKYLTVVLALFLTSAVVFYSSNTLSTDLPDCATLGGTADPGTNCTFFGLPLCSALPSGTTPNHRVNCADLSDLPLCSDISDTSGSQVFPEKNCVKECNAAEFASLPISDRYNKHCVRFCDNPEADFTSSGATLNLGSNCTDRKCHQLPKRTDPTSANCSNLACNLLTADELNDAKFDFSIPADYSPTDPDAPVPKKYCEGNNLKCHQFSEEKLKYLGIGNRIRTVNGLCKLHNCLAASTCATDEISIIKGKGPGYLQAYITSITKGYSLDDAQNASHFCEPVNCDPTVNSYYACSKDADNNPTLPDIAHCDRSGPGSVCSGGYCYAVIDCNLTDNKTKDVCLTSSTSDDGSVGTLEDLNNSWFYRPKPMEKSTLGGNSSNYREFTHDFCYPKGKFLKYWGTDTVLFGIFHSHNLPDGSRSPGMCGVTKIGNRGVGYGYLCGTHADLTKRVADYTAYHKGYTVSHFRDGDATHEVQVCTRFVNTLHPFDGGSESCGARECSVSCGFSWCSSQECGFDVCKTLSVKDSNPNECMFTSSLFENDPSRGCMARLGGGGAVDSGLRVRAVKFGNKICTFLDAKGLLAYSGIFLDGSQKISQTLANGATKTYCLSGTLDTSGNCQGAKNSNDDEWLTHKWRAALHIPYIQDDLSSSTSSTKGYQDIDGRLFQEQDCIKIPLRVSPPSFFNLGTADNSDRLFTPQVYISDARVKRGGGVSDGIGTNLGTTDFDYPEIDAQVGLNSVKLSLGLGFDGTEDADHDDPAGKATAGTLIPGVDYVADLYVKKGFSSANEPIFCLYEKYSSSDGNLANIERGCVKRKYPEINNSAAKRKINIARITNLNQLNNSSISLQYCADDRCGPTATLTNPNTTSLSCSYEQGRYKVCSQREECTRLNVECLQNEVDLQKADAENKSITQFLNIRSECNNILLPYCNQKRGMASDASASIIDQNPNSRPSDSDYYGWFNEICIVSGFENRLKQVLAKTTPTRKMGKCLIDPASPYLNDGDNSTNCDNGGKAPNCLCQEQICQIDPASPYLTDNDPATTCSDIHPREPNCLCLAGTGLSTSGTEEVRFQTPREAGLCIDMPLPQICPAIRYDFSTIQHNDDPDYVLSSINKNGDAVDSSHLYRTSGSTSAPTVLVRGHANFDAAIPGTDKIGECRGFWKYSTNSSGVNLKPRLACSFDGSGNAKWEETVQNPCIRYACPAVDDFKDDVLETHHGYAIWPRYSKTNDNLQSVTAASCVTGYYNKQDDTHKIVAQKDSNGFITGYTGGISPTRQCNQRGEFFGDVTNSCERIKCKPIHPPVSPSSAADWNAWRLVGGAEYGEGKASRVIISDGSNPTLPESVASGECNQLIGFFPPLNGQPPSLDCDEFGNWRNLKNPCVTKCKAIPDPSQPGSTPQANDGYAYWDEKTNVPLNGEADGVITSASGNRGCIAGYVPYPYPSLKDKYGIPFTISETGPYRTDNDSVSGNRKIPRGVSADTRSIGLPQRVCKSVVITGNAAEVWTATSSGCINQCPGADTDPRIGVGITRDLVSAIPGYVETEWKDTNLGEDDYRPSSCGDVSGPHFVGPSDAEQNRDNNCYFLKRHCNSDGKWGDPIPVCIAHGSSDPSTDTGGKVGNAFYNTGTPAGTTNSAAVGSAAITATGCYDPTKFWRGARNTAALPQRQCVYKDSNKFIDQVYWKLASGSQDCETITCKIPTGGGVIKDSENRAIITITEDYVAAGQDRPVPCSKGVASSSVYTTLFVDATHPAPKVQCQSDGNWSPVLNAGSCKKGCKIPNSSATTIDHNLNADDCDGGLNFHLSSFTLAHGQSTTFAACDTCTSEGDEGYTWLFYASCNDGTPFVVDTTYDHSENYRAEGLNNSNRWDIEDQYMCPIREYSTADNAWHSVVSGTYGGKDSASPIVHGNQRGVVRNYKKSFTNRAGESQSLTNITGTTSGWHVYINPQ